MATILSVGGASTPTQEDGMPTGEIIIRLFCLVRKADAMATRFLGEMYVPPGEGTNLWFFGQLVTFKIHSQSARVGVFQLITPPQGGIPQHRHAAQDETHYILRGRYEFRCANQRLHAEPSAVVHVPAG